MKELEKVIRTGYGLTMELRRFDYAQCRNALLGVKLIGLDDWEFAIAQYLACEADAKSDDWIPCIALCPVHLIRMKCGGISGPKRVHDNQFEILWEMMNAIRNENGFLYVRDLNPTVIEVFNVYPTPHETIHLHDAISFILCELGEVWVKLVAAIQPKGEDTHDG